MRNTFFSNITILDGIKEKKIETYIDNVMITSQRIVFFAIEQPIEELPHNPSG